MLLTPYRLAAQALLADVPAPRKPFLRRSLRPDALLTTDLPRLVQPQALEALEAAITGLGWTVQLQAGLWELTPVLTPSAPLGPVLPGPDRPHLRRLYSLLSRHPAPGGSIAPVLAFLKAEEAGPQPLERLCQALCRQCAVCLRAHQRLPGELLPYVQSALAEEGKT